MSKAENHFKICKHLNETYISKNHDYGDSFGRTFHKLGIISAITRISDKYNRLEELCSKPKEEQEVKEESIEDTLLDMANYCIMTLIELGNKNQNCAERDLNLKDYKDYKKLIYTGHPYGGLKENEEKIANIILELQKEYPDYLFISPIHCFSYAYHETDYQTGIDMCLNLLHMCDEMWVFGNWKNSKGCKMEIEHCKENQIPYYIK